MGSTRTVNSYCWDGEKINSIPFPIIAIIGNDSDVPVLVIVTTNWYKYAIAVINYLISSEYIMFPRTITTGTQVQIIDYSSRIINESEILTSRESRTLGSYNEECRQNENTNKRSDITMCYGFGGGYSI